MNSVQYLGLDCIEQRNERLALLVTKSLGPRVLSLRLTEGENLFAQLPDLVLDCPGSGGLHLYGGHRLWHAPEVPARTYLPDDQPQEITQNGASLHVIQPVEKQTGLQKSLEIRLINDEATVIVDHTIKNHGLWPVECALWAITQVRPGGVAILPQATELADPSGVLPNRQLVLWPYTDINGAQIHWGNEFILIDSTKDTGPLKIGFPNPAGWLAYHTDDTLFVKYARYQVGADYLDHGASSQCYCRPEFLELETLGPRTQIQPGDSVSHQEIWRVFPDIQFSATEDNARDLAAHLALNDYLE